jgi:hypothetical protein
MDSYYTRQLEVLKNKLNLSFNQLAELFQVDEKTIFTWFSNGYVDDVNGTKIKVMTVSLNILTPYDNLIHHKLKNVWNVNVNGKSFVNTINEHTDFSSLVEKTIVKLHELIPHLVRKQNV